MHKHKSEDFKMSVVEYYLTEDVSQEQVCRIFKNTQNKVGILNVQRCNKFFFQN